MVIAFKPENEMTADLPTLSPPPYAQSSSTSTNTSPELFLLRRVAPPIARCNNIAIKRSGGTKVSGSYVIDPELEIPVEMLAPLEEGQERKNLLIDVPSANVDVDLWVVENPLTTSAIVPVGDDKLGPRVNVEVKGCYVNLRLHSSGDRPIALKVMSHTSAHICLDIPSNFRGPLTIHSSGNVRFSPALEPMVATFSDYDDVRKCFIGNFKDFGFGQGAWEGSAIEVHTSTGRVKIRFVDEPEPQAPPSKSWWKLGA